MKFLVSTIAVTTLLCALSAGAFAKDQGRGNYEKSYGYHPCDTAKQAVTKACKKGDPCAPACAKANKKYKSCRKINNLPQHEAGGTAQKADCTAPEDLPGAPVDNTPSVGTPVNPLRSNHF